MGVGIETDVSTRVGIAVESESTQPDVPTIITRKRYKPIMGFILEFFSFKMCTR